MVEDQLKTHQATRERDPVAVAERTAGPRLGGRVSGQAQQCDRGGPRDGPVHAA